MTTPRLPDLGENDPWAAAMNVALLTAEEEVGLAQRIEAGVLADERLHTDHADDPDTVRDLRRLAADGRAAYEHFVLANVRLARWCARKRHRAGAGGTLSVDDLTQVGMLGVIRAVQKFDYMQGTKFSTYALFWIRNHQQIAAWASNPLHASVADWEMRDRIMMIRGELQARGTDVSVPTLAAAAGLSCFETARLLSLAHDLISLDAPVQRGESGADATVWSELINAPADTDAEQAEADGAAVLDLVSRLNTREQRVVRLAFGLDDGTPRDVPTVARTLRVPEPMVAQTLRRALDVMRGTAHADHLVAA